MPMHVFLIWTKYIPTRPRLQSYIHPVEKYSFFISFQKKNKPGSGGQKCHYFPFTLLISCSCLFCICFCVLLNTISNKIIENISLCAWFHLFILPKLFSHRNWNTRLKDQLVVKVHMMLCHITYIMVAGYT